MDPAPDGKPVFAGRFTLLERLGSGGFGTVHRAYDNHLRIEVALKVTNSTVTDADLLLRFEREARVIARLSHENIVKIYDCGVFGSTPYYAMEFVAGDTLQRVMEANRVLPVRAAARIARDVALALHHAHINGVLHRDIKPHNIIIQPRDPTSAVRPAREKADAKSSISSSRGVLSEYRVVLTDFGLAKDLAAVTKLSVTGEVMGTPQYMAPEMAQGDSERVGAHTDVYSLGVVLYYLLSGRLPYEGGTFAEVLYNVVSREPPALKSVAPSLPNDLSAVVTKAIEKDPALRYRSALAFAEDLENVLKGEPVSAKPPPLTVKLRRWVRRNLVLCASVGSALLVAAAVGAWFGVIAPGMKRARERRELEAARASFLAWRAATETAAKERLAAAETRFAAGDYAAVPEMVEQLRRDFERFRVARGFPKERAPAPGWRDEFAAHIPFDIPLVDATILAGRACERAGARGEATRHHLRAHLAWADRPEGRNALFELARYFLRNREYAQAIYSFRKIDKGDPLAPRALLGLAFAYCGAGQYDRGIATFDLLLKGPLPTGAADFREEGALVSFADAEPTRETLEEARALAAMFAGRLEVAPVKDLHAVTLADLDGDGAQEILVPSPGKIEVYAHAGGRIERTRVLTGPGLDGTGAVAADFDGDGRPELAFGGRPPRVYRLAGDRLEPLHEGDAALFGFVAADLDGCGRPELLGGDHQHLRMLHVEGGGYRQFWQKHHMSTDVNIVQAVDVDGDGRLELVVVTGTWGADSGFRLWVYRVKRDGVGLLDSRPVGWLASSHLCALRDGGRTTFYFATSGGGGYARSLDIRYRQMQLDRLLGLCRVRWSEGALSAPELVWGRRVASFGDFDSRLTGAEIRGRPHALVAIDRDARLVALDTLRYLPVRCEDANRLESAHRFPRFGDLDGDGDAEIVAFPDNKLTVYGLQRAGAAGDEAVETRPAPLSGRALAYQDALFHVSTFLERGEVDTAIRFLENLMREFPEFEKDLLLRTASTQQQAWRWEDLIATLRRLRATFYLGGAEAAEADLWERAAADMLAMKERVVVDFTGGETLLTNAPLRFRLDRERGILRATGNSRAPGFVAVPIRSDEPSHSLEADVVVHRMDYVTGFSVGMSDGIETMGPSEAGAWVRRDWGRTVGVGAHGAGDTPGAWAQVWAASASSEPSMKGVPNLALVPSAAKVRVGLDYLRWANLVRGRIERDGREIAGREVTSAFRNPAQDAFLVVTTGGWAHVGDDYWNDVEVDRIVVRSAGALSTRAFVPRTARDFFLRAGGRYVVGDWAGALEDYERVLRLIAEGTYDPETLYRHFTFDGEATIDAARAEIGFLVAMTKWRLGRASEAEEAVAGLLATDPARALQLIKRNAVALDAAERDAVRAGFWRWARGKSLQQIVDVAAPAFKFIPNGGLPAWEILFFDEPRDLDASRAVFEMLANGRSYGVRTMASLLRMRARLARAQGRHADARRDLEEALKQLETGEVDEFNRYPLKREIERLMREWSE